MASMAGWRGGSAWTSAFGARFDMETDAATVFGLSLLVWLCDQAGPWVLAIGLMRYIFVARKLGVAGFGGAFAAETAPSGYLCRAGGRADPGRGAGCAA